MSKSQAENGDRHGHAASPNVDGARVQELAGRIAALEKELVELTAGQLDAVVTQNTDAPFLLSEARRALTESERRFRAIFDGALDCMFICDDARCYVDANPAACRFIGLPKKEIIGKTLGDFMDIVEVDDMDARWESVLEAGSETGVYHLRRPDGQQLMVEYSVVAEVVPGSHLVVVRDVTDQRTAQKMRDELYAELEHRNQGLLALHGIGVKLGESLEIHDVYETIFREFTYHFLDSPHLAVALFDQEKQHFVCDFAVVDGEVFDPSLFPPMPLGEGPTTRAFQELAPQIIDIERLAEDLPDDRIVHLGDEAEPRSGLYVPLVVNNEAIGVLSIQHYDANAFQDVDMTLLSVMANHAAAAISNARLYSQTQQEIADRKRREYELAAIATLSRDLRTVQDPAAVINILLAQTANIFGAVGSAVVFQAERGSQRPEIWGRGEYVNLDHAQLDLRQVVGRARLLNGAATIRDSGWQGTTGRILGVVGVPLSVQNIQMGAVWLGLDRLATSHDLGLLASLADIAASTIQRARLYEQVQLQAQRLSRVMDTVIFGLLLLDKERRILIANQPAVHGLEVLTDARTGDILRELGGIALDTLLETPHGEVFGREIVLEDGSARVYDVLANPVEIEGETDGWVLVIRDITRDRELQNQLQRQDRLAAVGQLAAGIAHDFNNILAVIVLYVQMLQRGQNLGEAEQKRLGVVREQAQHASALVRQVLDFSRMSVMERGPVDLIDLVHNTIGMWQRVLPENMHIAFTLQDVPQTLGGAHTRTRGTLSNTDVEPWGTATGHGAEDRGADDAGSGSARDYVVDGDLTRLQQVLMNLAVNARDAMPEGGELQIDLSRRTFGMDDVTSLKELPPGEWICLTVADTGSGISPENLVHVFDPFFTTKAVGQGTGLGLAQVYGIVRQHGGHVTVESDVDVGTRFYIFLPPAHTQPADSDAPQEEPAPDAAESGVVLLVEDNDAARDATRAILELYDYEVIEAQNGVEALEAFQDRANAIDLVLTDVVMPEMGGLELFESLTGIKPDVCVLFMTGYPLDERGRELIELGTVDWLQKPFTIQQLTEKIRNLLDSAPQ